MNTERKESMDWELDSLARAISSFFERKIEGQGGHYLGKLTRALAVKAGGGSSHLVQEEADKIYENWQSLPAIGDDEDLQPLVKTEDGKLYFRRFYESEKQIASSLSLRLRRTPMPVKKGVVDFFHEFIANQVDDQQALAVATALHNDLFCLAGGPGTGKTRTIVAILAAHFQMNPEMNISLAAPTGKAAFRMRESILETMEKLDLPKSINASLKKASSASTIHRLLGSKLNTIEFQKNENNPLHSDLVIVDEASMVDLFLMAKLCGALRDETKLILVGDPDQLAPVQGGAVFNGLIKGAVANFFRPEQMDMYRAFSTSGAGSSEDNPLIGRVVALSRVHRREGNAGEDVLGHFCEAIREGRADDAANIATQNHEILRLEDKSEDPSVNDIIQKGFTRLTQAQTPIQALSGLNDFRILCPHNQGYYGVSNWNERTQKLLQIRELEYQPIIVCINDYSLNLHNGDEGVRHGDRVYFSSEEGVREVSLSRLSSYLEGFASSIHRSQGSEYEDVLIVLPSDDAKLLSRELLYVAASRAKKRLTLVGNISSLIAAVNQTELGCSGVSELLKP